MSVGRGPHPLGLKVESWAYWKTPRQQLARLAVHTAASCGSQNWTATWCVMWMLVKWCEIVLVTASMMQTDVNQGSNDIPRWYNVFWNEFNRIYLILCFPTNDAGPTYLLQTHHIAAPSLTLRSAEHLIMRHAVSAKVSLRNNADSTLMGSSQFGK